MYKQPAPEAAEGGAGKKGLEKEKRDNERKVAVDRLWQLYFAESAGKLSGKAAAEQAAATRGRQMEGRAARGARSAL